MSSEARSRLGSTIKAQRLERGWSQRRLAASTGLSQPQLVAIEHGTGGSLDAVERLLRALDSSVAVTVRGPTTIGGQPSDATHGACVATLRRLLRRAGFATAVEQPVADGPIRGWIDLLAFDEQRRRLVVNETKSGLSDLGGLERQVDLYVRTCLEPARRLGWRPREVMVAVTVLATNEADAFVTGHRAELAAEFSMRGRWAARAVLDGGPITGRGLLAIDPRRPGRNAFMTFSVDGRRRSFAYRDARDFATARQRAHGR